MSRIARVVPFDRVRRFQAHIDPPFPGESLLGFVTRALSVTVAKRLSTGLALAGVNTDTPLSTAMRLTDERQIAGIAKLFQTTPDQIRERVHKPGHFDHSSIKAVDFFGVKIRFHYREKAVRRVSPRALSLAAYHRAIWELRPFTFDPQTRERLLDTCPVCSQKLGWLKALGPTMCDHCIDERGFPSVDLRDFPQPNVEVEDEEALDFVTGLVDPDLKRKAAARRLLPDWWAKYPNGDLFETVMALASGLTLDPSVKLQFVGRSKDLRRFEMLTPDMLAIAGRAIIGGEAGFSTLAARYRLISDKRPHFYGVWKELGQLVQVRYDQSLNPKIKKYLSGMIDADMKRNRIPGLRPHKDHGDGYQPISWLAGKALLRRQRVKLLAESGLVKSVRAVGAKKSPVRLPADEVLTLVPQLRDALTPPETAAQIGVHQQALPALAARHLIVRLEGPVLGFLPGRAAYSGRSVDVLVRNIRNCIVSPVPRSAIRMSLAVRQLGTAEAPWDAIVSAMLSGDIVPYGSGEDRLEMLSILDSSAFAQAIRKHLLVDKGERDPWVGAVAASEILKTGKMFVSTLARKYPGILKAKKVGYDPYLRDDVLNVAKKYIFVAEIRDRAGLTNRGVPSWLQKLGVRPAIKLKKNKDYGYLRDEVEKLLTPQKKANSERSAGLEGAPDNPRTRILRAVASGKSVRDAAKESGVFYGTAHNWVADWRTTGSWGPKQRASKLNDHRVWLDKLVAKDPTITSGQIMKAFKDEKDVIVGRAAINWYLECRRVPLDGRRREPRLPHKKQLAE